MEIKKSKKANLENRKLLFREVGVVVALLVVLVAFEWPSREKKQAALLEDDRIVVAEEEMVAIEEPEQPQPTEVRPPQMMQDEFILVEDDVKVDNIRVISEEDQTLALQISNYVGGSGVGDEAVVEDDIPFAVVEDKPSFMGGDENAFTRWVNDHLDYDDRAKEAGIQGRITVQFVIATDGRVTEVKILRGLDPMLDKEVLRVMAMAPKWEPGKQRGKPVRVKYVFPVIFRLQ